MKVYINSLICQKEIDKLNYDGKTCSEIANKMNQSRYVLSKYVRNPSTHGTKIKNSGQISKINTKRKKQLKKLASNKKISLWQLENKVDYKISRMFICKTLRIIGIVYQKLNSNPILSESHIQRPVLFVEDILRKGENSYEKRFNLGGPD